MAMTTLSKSTYTYCRVQGVTVSPMSMWLSAEARVEHEEGGPADTQRIVRPLEHWEIADCVRVDRSGFP